MVELLSLFFSQCASLVEYGIGHCRELVNRGVARGCDVGESSGKGSLLDGGTTLPLPWGCRG